MRLFDNQNSTAGKVTVSIMIAGFAVFSIFFLVDLEQQRAAKVAHAQTTDNATTTVTVLNTPPVWTVDAQEVVESSTSSPTNATTSLSWHATGTDSNGEDYWLIICATSTAATANADAPPTCAGGASETWAVSATTTSGTRATATYTTLVSDNERNEWWASICDANSTTPRCNSDIQQGSGNTESPFHVNHRPSFDFMWTSEFADPGQIIEFAATASDADTLGSDTVRVFVCKTAGFDYVNVHCQGEGWATSTLSAQDPATTTTIEIPYQDGQYDAFAFVVDTHDFAALESTSEQGTNTPITVNNVAPEILPGEVVLNGGVDMSLATPQGETSGFYVTYIARDNNSCVANASTTSEFNAARVSVFRENITEPSCNEEGEFDVNNCYTTASSTNHYFTFTDPVASSTVNNCTGPDDIDQGFEFNFSLWYTADPTDGIDLTDSTWFDEQWYAAVEVSDDDLASSTATTSTNGVDVESLLAFDLNTLSIAYGSLEPGNTTTPITATTTILATGNVGLDQNLDGEDMCTDYTGFDSCYDPSPLNATSTILVGNQVYATSGPSESVSYTDSKVVQLSSAPTEFEINVLKTTATSSPSEGDTIWGIAIPATIELSGDYEGQNTFTAVKGEAQDW